MVESFCSGCGSRIPEGSSVCPACGRQVIQGQPPVQTAVQTDGNRTLYMVLMLLLSAGLTFFLGLIGLLIAGVITIVIALVLKGREREGAVIGGVAGAAIGLVALLVVTLVLAAVFVDLATYAYLLF